MGQKTEEALESAWLNAEQKLTAARVRIRDLERQLKIEHQARRNLIATLDRHVTDMLDYWKQEAQK